MRLRLGSCHIRQRATGGECRWIGPEDFHQDARLGACYRLYLRSLIAHYLQAVHQKLNRYTLFIMFNLPKCPRQTLGRFIWSWVRGSCLLSKGKSGAVFFLDCLRVDRHPRGTMLSLHESFAKS